MIASSDGAGSDDALASKPRGLFFDDFEIGMELESPARTITATDITKFADLTGDFNELHINAEYVRDTPFGEVIAHGPMVYAIAAGLAFASGVNSGTLLALLQVDKWRVLAPTKHGDTVRLVQKVIEKKITSNPDRGIIKFDRRVLNQRDTVVIEMEATMMYRCRSYVKT